MDPTEEITAHRLDGFIPHCLVGVNVNGEGIVKGGILRQTFIPLALVSFDEPSLLVKSDWGGTHREFYIGIYGFHGGGVFLRAGDIGCHRRIFVDVVRQIILIAELPVRDFISLRFCVLHPLGTLLWAPCPEIDDDNGGNI